MAGPEGILIKRFHCIHTLEDAHAYILAPSPGSQVQSMCGSLLPLPRGPGDRANTHTYIPEEFFSLHFIQFCCDVLHRTLNPRNDHYMYKETGAESAILIQCMPLDQPFCS